MVVTPIVTRNLISLSTFLSTRGRRCNIWNRRTKWPVIDTYVWLYSYYYMFLILFNGANVYDDTDKVTNVTWTHPFYCWLATTVWLSPFSYHQYRKKPIFRFDGLHCWFKASLLLLLWRHHYNSCVCQRHWFISAFNLTINSLFTNIAPPFHSDYYHYIRKKVDGSRIEKKQINQFILFSAVLMQWCVFYPKQMCNVMLYGYALTQYQQLYCVYTCHRV